VALRPHLSMGLPFRSRSLSLLQYHEVHEFFTYLTHLYLACLSLDLSNFRPYPQVIPIPTPCDVKMPHSFSTGPVLVRHAWVWPKLVVVTTLVVPSD
jgi:hypothetical protein